MPVASKLIPWLFCLLFYRMSTHEAVLADPQQNSMSVFISPAAAAVPYVKEETGIFHPGSRWRTRGGQWTCSFTPEI